MAAREKILILGGTSEASAMARALAGDARFDAILSLAGRTKSPVLPNISSRVGGFGGAEGLLRYLTDERISAVVDATHPYAETISANAVAAARFASCPLLRILRPPWIAEEGDRWTHVASMVDAAAALGAARRRVFVTVGRQDLAPFVAAPWHTYVIRSVDPPPPDCVPPGAKIIAGRGPFALSEEIELLRAHRIEVIVTKNSGGDATRPKLLAARNLGVDIVMVARPAPAADIVATVETAAEALAWLGLHHAAHSDGASAARPSRTMP